MSGSRKAIWAGIGAIVLISTVAGAWGMAMSLYANHRQDTQASEAAKTAEAPKSELSRYAVGPLAALQTPAELKPAPEYMFRDRNGTAVRFDAFRGKVVVVNLWAMWCAPCREEMPTLAALAREGVLRVIGEAGSSTIPATVQERRLAADFLAYCGSARV